MNRTRSTILVGALSLAVVLAACGQAVAKPNPPDADPTPALSPTETPTPTATPSPTPKPTPVMTPKPSATPAPSRVPEKPTAPTPQPITLVEHETPMVGRSLADGVNVRERPDLQAPVLRWDNGDDVFDVRLAADQLVVVRYGPLYADGESWYEVTSYGDEHRAFGYGWVAGRFLAPEPRADFDPGQMGIRGLLTGLGTGGSISADVEFPSALGVVVAAAPMPGIATCEIDLDVIVAGTRVDAAHYIVRESIANLVAPWDIGGPETGVGDEMTFEVDTDCSFALLVQEFSH
jgi:hypothetical protein